MATTEFPKPHKDLTMEGRVAKWFIGYSSSYVEAFVKLARRVAGRLPPNSAVLDVATGAGYFCLELAKLGPYSITGLDISHTLVELANQKALETGVAVDFRQGSASAMPFADNCFDFLLCRGAFKNFAEPVLALKEMCRVLKPEGQGLIIDLKRDASTESMNRGAKSFSIFNRIVHKFSYRFLVRKNAYTRQQFELMLSQTKFRSFEIKETESNYEIFLWK
jgi:ubiquinone/menaquinone biosynthesis C-methylase UbiE